MTALAIRGQFTFRHYRNHRLIDTRKFPNAVVEEGANLLLDTMFRGGPQHNWYIGLILSPATLLGTDTMANHPNWTEVVAYSEGSRQPWDLASPAAARKIANASGDAAVFHFTANTIVAGAFLTNSGAKGGTAGTLFCTAFSSSTLVAGDALAVSYQLQIS